MERTAGVTLAVDGVDPEGGGPCVKVDVEGLAWAPHTDFAKVRHLERERQTKTSRAVATYFLQNSAQCARPDGLISRVLLIKETTVVLAAMESEIKDHLAVVGTRKDSFFSKNIKNGAGGWDCTHIL